MKHLKSAFALAAMSALATAGNLSVTVVDKEGKPVADADVELTNPEIGFARKLHSDAKGLLRLDGLTTAGTWKVTALASADHGASEPVELVLRSNYTSSVTLRLPAGGAGPSRAGLWGISAQAGAGAEVAGVRLHARRERAERRRGDRAPQVPRAADVRGRDRGHGEIGRAHV